MAHEQAYYDTSFDCCQCGETSYSTVIYRISIPWSHQYALSAGKPECPEVALILDDKPIDQVQDHKIIDRIIPEQNDEHTERMKLIPVANIEKFSDSKRKEEIAEYVETHSRRGTAFALGMPMTVFQPISDGIAKFSQ
jgi:hypothetical protein